MMRGGILLLFAAASVPNLPELEKMSARFAPVEIRADTAKLSAGDRKALPKLIEAAHIIDRLYMTQLWSGDHALYAKLQRDTSPLGRARLAYFWLNKGPWSDLDDHKAFLPDVPARKPLGANFYPEDMTKQDFESWEAKLPKDQREQATSYFTVIRRDPKTRALRAIPYNREYAADLARLASLLREAAAATNNASLKRFLDARAAAFLSNDYYASDIAWMDLDAPLEVTIGPYETYMDELFGYKAAFEAYITMRDDEATARVKFFAGHLQEIENNLPIDPKYRNPKIGALAPIRVVNEIVAAGDAAHGVRTAAYNLPNDERVVKEKGSKRVMLKNIQEAKFNRILVPVSKRVLAPSAQSGISFDAFFTHILAHELTHGIGPHQARVNGRDTTPRLELKDLYSAVEEAKADVCGLFMLQYMMDHGQPSGVKGERELYTTYLASGVRSLGFGINEAHGKGMAVQMNYLMDKGAVTANADGTLALDQSKMKGAVRDLAHDLLTIEATGDYAGAKKLLDRLAVIRPPLQKALDKVRDVPVDIAPREAAER